MKPHTFAQMVNEVRDLALNFGASQQFRDRASDLMSKYIPIESSPESGISIAVLADVALDVHAMQYKIEQKDEEIERLRSRIAELEAKVSVVPEQAEAPAVVVPEVPMGTALQRLGLRLTQILDGHEFAVLEHEFLNPALEEMQKLSIPADRVPGEGMAALRRFAERCAQRDHQPDEHIGSAKCVACEAEDALRANQGGADHA